MFFNRWLFFNRGKYAVGSLKKKMSADNPHVAMFALQVISSLPFTSTYSILFIKRVLWWISFRIDGNYIQMKYDRMCAVECFYKDVTERNSCIVTDIRVLCKKLWFHYPWRNCYQGIYGVSKRYSKGILITSCFKSLFLFMVFNPYNPVFCYCQQNEETFSV